MADRESDALELEKNEFSRWMNEANEDADLKAAELRQQAAAKGVLHSGRLGLLEAELRFNRAVVITEKAIELRKTLGRRLPSLLTEEKLKQLRDWLWERTDGIAKASAKRFPGNESASASLVTQIDLEARSLKTKTATALNSLRLEAKIGMHQDGSKPPVVINISESTIASLNLGNVYGDLTASVRLLKNEGHADLADAARRMTELVAAQQDLDGERRKEMLEHLAVISTETSLPSEKRKLSPLKTSIAFLRDAVGVAANLAALWPHVEMLLKAAGVPL